MVLYKSAARVAPSVRVSYGRMLREIFYFIFLSKITSLLGRKYCQKAKVFRMASEVDIDCLSVNEGRGHAERSKFTVTVVIPKTTPGIRSRHPGTSLQGMVCKVGIVLIASNPAHSINLAQLRLYKSSISSSQVQVHMFCGGTFANFPPSFVG